ncbi:hypothetical protein [Salinicola avicenniae]|uniref:hypothetical protein n=1 Tax=Salinicola avicenniae TaxID=2916836 RepID=UPI0020732381|nr:MULTISPECIES: hypothetical protein [unclassified Salinicola]
MTDADNGGASMPVTDNLAMLRVECLPSSSAFGLDGANRVDYETAYNILTLFDEPSHELVSLRTVGTTAFLNEK